ncbi:MAG: hypothetical protein R8P61_06925 [Bacteroidia bacterium]|nr:hypothetical protein [Bacteroidia bacterium]
MNSSLRIITTGLIAQHHHLGGVSWDYLQYVLGLHRMGHEVYYIEDSGEWPYTLDGGVSGNDWVAKDCKANIDHLNQLFSAYDLADRWAYHFPTQNRWYGLSEGKRTEVIRSADLLINVSGTLMHPEHYRSVKQMIYIDSDPAFTQVKILKGEQEFTDRLKVHDHHFSFGERMSEEFQNQPFYWQPTRTPICMEEWEVGKPSHSSYTTIMNWTSYPPIHFGKYKLGQKDVELLHYLALPQKLPEVSLEIAMPEMIHSNWQSHQLEGLQTDNLPEISPRELLKNHGWKLKNPMLHCRDFGQYRKYIESSRAEWSVAKGGYVHTPTAWFSCRSACYLAAGKPVVVQDTGFPAVIPTGEGVLSFSNMESAEASIREVEGKYELHSRTARDIAQSYFDANKVLQHLIESTLISNP